MLSLRLSTFLSWFRRHTRPPCAKTRRQAVYRLDVLLAVWKFRFPGNSPLRLAPWKLLCKTATRAMNLSNAPNPEVGLISGE
jgi:hypothetical protein